MLSRAVAAIALLVSSPILLLAALAIKMSSRGPVLFTAPRAGEHGRTFTILKLRTMRLEGSSRAPAGRITGGADLRVYPLGRWLRRWKIDELPQLVNILRGEMVIVGPRPEDCSIVNAHYTAQMRETLIVPPGLTSPGSLDYFGGERSLPQDPAEAERLYLTQLLPHKIALDVVYVRHRSWRYDLELVVRTAASLLGISRRLFPQRQAWEQRIALQLLAAPITDEQLVDVRSSASTGR